MSPHTHEVVDDVTGIAHPAWSKRQALSVQSYQQNLTGHSHTIIRILVRVVEPEGTYLEAA